MFHFSLILSSNIHHILFRFTLVNNFLSLDNKLKCTASIEVLIHFYFGYIHSHRSYRTFLWANNSYSNIFFIANKKTIRLICWAPNIVPCRKLFVILGVMPPSCIYIFQYHARIYNYKIRYCNNIKKYSCKYSKKCTFLCIMGTSVRLISCLVQLET